MPSAIKLNNFDEVSGLGLGELYGIFGEFNGCAGIKINGAEAKRFKGRQHINYHSVFIQKDYVYCKAHKKGVDAIRRGQNQGLPIL